MWMLNKMVICGVAGLLLAALPAAAKAPHKARPRAVPASKQYAIIQNSGSTNTTGYYLMLSNQGIWQASDQKDSPSLTVPKNQMPLVAKLFHDLKAAMPLTSLPAGHGARSASFGTETYVTYKGQQSPDLTFASDLRTAALKADIAALTSALGVRNTPKHLVIMK